MCPTIQPGVVCDPVLFCKPFATTFTADGSRPTVTMGDFETKETWEQGKKNILVRQKKMVLVVLESVGGSTDDFPEIAINKGDHGWACSGSGDGFNHYLAWETVAQMPRVYA